MQLLEVLAHVAMKSPGTVVVATFAIRWENG